MFLVAWDKLVKVKWPESQEPPNLHLLFTTLPSVNAAQQESHRARGRGAVLTDHPGSRGNHLLHQGHLD